MQSVVACAVIPALGSRRDSVQTETSEGIGSGERLFQKTRYTTLAFVLWPPCTYMCMYTGSNKCTHPHAHPYMCTSEYPHTHHTATENPVLQHLL